MFDTVTKFESVVDSHLERLFSRQPDLCTGDAKIVAQALLIAAANRAQEEEESPDSHQTSTLLCRAEEVAFSIFNVYSSSFTSHLPDRAHWRFEADPGRFVDTAVGLEGFFIDQKALETATGKYLESEFRHPAVDKALMLAWLDTSCLGVVLYFNKPDDTDGTYLERVCHPVKSTLDTFLIGRIIVAKILFFLGFILFLGLIFLLGWEPPKALRFSGLCTLSLFSIETLFTVTTSVIAFKDFRKYANGVQAGLKEIEQIHPIFRGKGPISAVQFREKMRKLEATKVMDFHPSLAALLDDVEARFRHGK